MILKFFHFPKAAYIITIRKMAINLDPIRCNCLNVVSIRISIISLLEKNFTILLMNEYSEPMSITNGITATKTLM
jgi:hypothetical protein